MPEVTDTTVPAKPRRFTKRGLTTVAVVTALAVATVAVLKTRSSNDEDGETSTVETPAA